MPDLPYRHLNLFMAKQSAVQKQFSELLASDSNVESYPLAQRYKFDGILYVKRSEEKRPNWTEVLDAITGIEHFTLKYSRTRQTKTGRHPA